MLTHRQPPWLGQVATKACMAGHEKWANKYLIMQEQKPARPPGASSYSDWLILTTECHTMFRPRALGNSWRTWGVQ